MRTPRACNAKILLLWKILVRFWDRTHTLRASFDSIVFVVGCQINHNCHRIPQDTDHTRSTEQFNTKSRHNWKRTFLKWPPLQPRIHSNGTATTTSKIYQKPQKSEAVDSLLICAPRDASPQHIWPCALKHAVPPMSERSVVRRPILYNPPSVNIYWWQNTAL